MHNKIFKYELYLLSRQVISIPIGAAILDVQSQNEKICLWAMVDETIKTELRTIDVIGTGQAFKPINPDQNRQHIGSVQHFGMVWHIFEIVNK